ncbi:hypothetical protein GCM10022226_40070 [Sphaerisporangium flaviroseum]|uniref:Acyl-CoA dehydrogenase n=2 Tax=Sphaerisporangium flaviroseum TaxID=509199 RepID=A0ABP7ICV5_9ACTN
MPSGRQNVTPESGAPSFLDDLATGGIDWDLYLPFPTQNPAEKKAEEDFAEEVAEFVRSNVDPDEVDRTGALPKGLVDDLRARGYFRLRNGAGLGGFELSHHGAFRVFERAAAWSVPVGQLLAIQNAVGAAALLAALPPGPLHDFVRGRVADGVVSAFAGTEPAGANNAWPGTTATPADDGASYLLHGEKLYTGNGDIAELLALTVTLPGAGDDRRVGVAFVDTGSPGFRVTSHLEFMGSKGLPNAALRLDGVRIPREHVLAGEPGQPRFPASIGPIALLSAVHFNAAPALAIARQCVRWSREFLARRAVNGRGLAGYEQIQRLATASLADLYAIDTVVRWCLLGGGPSKRWFELSLAKNICTTVAWRIVDRTVSLLGGEGLETAPGKRRRGATAAPVERLFRDARGLRVSGNVDFLLDIQAGRLVMARFFAGPHDPLDRPEPQPGGLSPANHRHLRAASAGIGRLARTCSELAARYPDPAALDERQHILGLIGKITAELLTMCAVLSRAAHGDQDLAHAHCAGARDRLESLWRLLDDRDSADEPDFAGISDSWLAGRSPSFLTDDQGDRS